MIELLFLLVSQSSESVALDEVELEPPAKIEAPAVVEAPESIETPAPVEAPAAAPAPTSTSDISEPPSSLQNQAGAESKEVVYQKVTNLDLQGGAIEGEKGLPQDFFLYNVKTPKIKSFLEDRLKFSLKHYNDFSN